MGFTKTGDRPDFPTPDFNYNSLIKILCSVFTISQNYTIWKKNYTIWEEEGEEGIRGRWGDWKIIC